MSDDDAALHYSNDGVNPMLATGSSPVSVPISVPEANELSPMLGRAQMPALTTIGPYPVAKPTPEPETDPKAQTEATHYVALDSSISPDQEYGEIRSVGL